jgi:hypothetical protein
MKLVGVRGQQQIDDYFDASGTITAGGTAQLLLAQRKSCSSFFFQNLSTGNLYLQFGLRPATATLTSGVVSSIAVNDAGFGFNAPPSVFIWGGGNANDPASYGGALPGWPSPMHPATAVATISGGAINAINVTDGGSGYLVAPYVFVQALRSDPTGVGIPSATAGILVPASGGLFSIVDLTCPTTAVAVYGATTGQAYTCKWMD